MSHVKSQGFNLVSLNETDPVQLPIMASSPPRLCVTLSNDTNPSTRGQEKHRISHAHNEGNFFFLI